MLHAVPWQRAQATNGTNSFPPLGALGPPLRVVVLSCRDGVQSEEVAKLNTGKDAGYRLLMHPSGRSLVRAAHGRHA